MAFVLAMAMFVLVVDTSLMNVSISAVVGDLDTTVSGLGASLQVALLVPIIASLIGLFNSSRMMRLREIEPRASIEGRRWAEANRTAFDLEVNSIGHLRAELQPRAKQQLSI